MPTRLRRGFKADAERLSLEIRAELELCAHDPFNCETYATHLGIPIVTLQDLAADGARPQSIRRLTSSTFNFSALTLCVGDRRLIVYNPAHARGRRANSLAHELSHVVLEHPSSPPLDIGGCRRWDATVEEEANWQAAALLVPRDGALKLTREGYDLASGAEYFGVSEALYRWRVHQTGIARQVDAAQRFRRR
jgi:hypothetical protein